MWILLNCGGAVEVNGVAAAKISFDSSLNVVDKSHALRTGEILAENPIGSASYARLQRESTTVRFVSDLNMREMSLFNAYENSVTVNMLRHSSPEEAVSTIVHEATHQNGFFKGIAQNSQFTEYQAFRNESLFMNGQRPSLTERQQIWRDVQSLYPNLPQGKYPFGGNQ
jgi:polyribonucleotide nucleotidyltransferase